MSSSKVSVSKIWHTRLMRLLDKWKYGSKIGDNVRILRMSNGMRTNASDQLHRLNVHRPTHRRKLLHPHSRLSLYLKCIKWTSLQIFLLQTLNYPWVSIGCLLTWMKQLYTSSVCGAFHYLSTFTYYSRHCIFILWLNICWELVLIQWAWCWALSKR